MNARAVFFRGFARRIAAGARSRSGFGLVLVLGVMMVLSAMALALLLLTITQTAASANERRASAALCAAEAGLERALPDLLRAPDWDAVLDGRVRSGFADGGPSGSRVLAGGGRISLDEVAAMANCGRPSGCTDAQMNDVTTERPWGPNNPRWRPFAYGPLASLLPAGGPLLPTEYLVVMVADDPAEVDGNALRDGRAAASQGAGVLQLRAEAFGPDNAHRVVEMTVARGTARPRASGYAAQRGQGATGGAGAGGDVQVPGGSLTRSEMTLDGGLTRR